jgi:hypothetical protein
MTEEHGETVSVPEGAYTVAGPAEVEAAETLKETSLSDAWREGYEAGLAAGRSSAEHEEPENPYS